MTHPPTSHSPAARRAPRILIVSVAFASAVIAVVAGNPCDVRARIAGTGVPALPDELVTASLVSDAQAIAPGQTFRLAIRFAPREGWHLNWLNPGDAGLAPSVKWHFPDGFRAAPPCWPFPERFKTGPLVIFGYPGELLLVVDVRAPAGLAAGASAEFRAEVSWLACADACVPGSAEVSLTLPVRDTGTTDAAWASRFEESLLRCPMPSGEWSVAASLDPSGTIALDISAGGATRRIEDVFFYPYDPGFMDNAAPQRLSAHTGPAGRAVYQLRVELSRMAAAIPPRVSGILVSRSGWSGGDAAQAIEFDVPLQRR